MSGEATLPVEPGRAHLMRIESAALLKRWLHLERALLIACAGWVPAARRLETKALLARTAWQSSLTAEALKQRIFELRYPERELALGRPDALVSLYETALHPPGPGPLLDALSGVLLPALRSGYEAYLSASDEIADGPSRRFLHLAVTEKLTQEQELAAAAASEDDPDSVSDMWCAHLADRLEKAGGITLEDPRDIAIERVVPPGRPFRPAPTPARDERYFVSSFYWPDIVDPSYAYGHGVRLQLRSAISHLNEVWAVEAAAGTLLAFAPELGWDFLFDAARWLYDESRHMLMGARRLEWWGFGRHEIPLGSYIIESVQGEDPIYGLAMLAFFETKNIGKKRERAGELGGLGDLSSQRDMDFDWADEAIHTGYGRRWLRAALKNRGQDPESWSALVGRCEELVRARIARATPGEVEAIRGCADKLIARADVLAKLNA